MWQQLKVQSNDFLIKKVNNDNKYVIFVSNLIKIWSEELTEEGFYQRCKKFNPLVEGEQGSLIKWILSLLNSDTTASIKVIECADNQVLEMRSKLAGVPFVFKFYLELLTPEKFHKEMTLPLLFMIQQLQAQKEKLIELLRKKDVEISEYKMEGAQLSRKNIETATFIENQFEECCSTITIPIDVIEKPATLFTHEIRTLYADVLHKYEDKISLNKEETDTEEDSGKQSMQSDSSPEKKRKLNESHIKQEVSPPSSLSSQTQSEYKVKVKDENEDQKKQEEKILARQRKQAMKKKLLPL